MKFSLRSLKKPLRRLLPKNRIRKPLVGTLKTSSKLLGASVHTGAGAELTSHVSSKAQGVEDGSQYILIEDFGPSIKKVYNSAIARAHVAHEADLAHQKYEE